VLSGASLSQPRTPWTTFPGPRVRGEALAVPAGLPVEHDDRAAGPDRARVAEVRAHLGGVALAHAEPVTLGPAGLVRQPVVAVPDLGAPRVAPEDPGAIGRVVPVHPARELPRTRPSERLAAGVAIADLLLPQPAPAVVGEAVGPVSLGDLPKDGGHALPHPRAVHADRVEVAGHERLALGVAGEPVGVGAEDALVGARRVHAREDGEAGGARGGPDLAEEVPIAEGERAVVPLESGRVEGHDPAGVDDHPLRPHALPVARPERGVVGRGILLVEVRLHPAPRADEPRPGVRSGMLRCLLETARF